MVTQGCNFCGAIPSSLWNVLHHWNILLVIFVCRSVGSKHLWNLIWTPFPFYCFSSPWIGWAFSIPSSNHSKVVHVSEGVFFERAPATFQKNCNISDCNIVLCEETLVPLENFAIFMPVMLCYVRKHVMSIFSPLSNTNFQFQSTSTSYWVQAPSCASESTRWSWMWYQNLGN